MPTKRVAGKKKLKSIKAKLTDGMGSKRRLAKFGKEQRKGMRGSAANYITRSQALKKLQVTLKDFRRLCILKGVYPREPKKKPSGKDKTYYYVKDVMFLAHEPVLDKFREFKTFMKKVKKAMGRRDFEDAKRKHENRPTYSLDHIVKERYPRFIDALGDMDDALCLVHLFAMMPAGKGVDAQTSENCLRLVREWNNYVVASRALTKVFVSIKGIYYQASVQGQTVTWLVPHQFTPTVDKRVDVRVMLTFLEFYEVLLKFVHFQLYTELGVAYPPKIDLQLDQAGALLAALKLERTQASDATGDAEKSVSQAIVSSEAEKEMAKPTAAVTKQQKDSEKRIKTLAKTLGTAAFDDDGDDDDEAQTSYGELSEPLEAAFASNKLAAHIHHEQQKEASARSLFTGLVFFLSREVPSACLELVLRSYGALIGWDGAGSPFNEKDERITHHLMDRPHQGHRYFTREYVQPQWVFDSVNNGLLLPLARYVPGADLPPHLSPFVDDAAEGYTPEYRKQLTKLRSASQVMREVGDLERAGAEDDDDEEEENEEEAFAAGLKAELDGKAGDAGSDEEEEEEEEEEKAESSQKRKTAASSLSAQPSKKAKREEEAKELHELATNMMSKKAKRLYDRMQFGLGKKADKIQALEDKRQKLEDEKKAAPVPPPQLKGHEATGTSKKQKQKKKKSNGGKKEPQH